MPSDFPSVFPSAWGGDADLVDFPQDYDVCGLSKAVSTNDLNEITVIYLYRLELTEGAQRLTSTNSIEKALHESLLDSICSESVSNHATSTHVHAISTNP